MRKKTINWLVKLFLKLRYIYIYIFYWALQQHFIEMTQKLVNLVQQKYLFIYLFVKSLSCLHSPYSTSPFCNQWWRCRIQYMNNIIVINDTINICCYLICSKQNGISGCLTTFQHKRNRGLVGVTQMYVTILIKIICKQF